MAIITKWYPMVLITVNLVNFNHYRWILVPARLPERFKLLQPPEMKTSITSIVMIVQKSNP